MSLEIVPRGRWNAAEWRGERVPLDHPIEFIWLRPTFMIPPCLSHEKCLHTVKHLQQRDMNDPDVSDIRANFLVGDDGRVYEGRGWFVKPEFNKQWDKYDGEYLEIAYMGPFDGVPELRMQRMLHTVFQLYKKGFSENYLIDDVEFLNEKQDSDIDTDASDFDPCGGSDPLKI